MSISLKSRSSFHGRCRGFTLVELLAVIAIIGVLLALLLPAVQRIRESVRAATCQNHVRQIGLAFQSHHSAQRMFPTGGNDWWTPPNFSGGGPAAGMKQDAGWGYQVLPYIEQKAAWNPAGADDAARQKAAIAALVGTYFCPSRRGPQTVTYASSGYDLGGPLFGLELTHGLIDYAGSNLLGTGLLVQAGSDRQAQPRRATDVTDGLSKTLAVAEKRLNVAQLGQRQPDDNEGFSAGWDEDTVRRTEFPPDRDSLTDPSGGELFGSSHPSTFNAAFADGSVRGLSFTIDPIVFQNLGDIKDGRVMSSDAF